MRTSISVAMATYNGAAFLQEQLDSLAAQSLPPAELVVSDDGSTDATMAVVRSFQERAPFPVHVLEKRDRLGYADNFLHAAAACRHEMVAFCDQDDVWLPTKLEMASRRLAEDDSLLALHPLILTDARLNPIGRWTQDIERDRIFAPLELNPYITGWGNTMLFRRELVTLIARERRPRQPEHPERPLSHDTWVYVLAAALGRVSHVDLPLILYRQHDGAAVGATHPTRWQRLGQLIRPPLLRLREQSAFDRQMAELFGELAESPGAFARPAREAAVRFSQRHDYLQTRVRTFDDASWQGRLAAFRSLPNLASDWPFKRSTRVKDFIGGVLGLSRLSAAWLS